MTPKLAERAPAVSVLMPVYNGETHLRAAIESVLRQRFRDFALVTRLV
jgi:glycosyltransferase involved in cell wall biosynthesis